MAALESTACKPLKIDIHNHILPSPEAFPDFCGMFNARGYIQLQPLEEEGWAMMRQDGRDFRKVQRNCWCPETRIKEMDDQGVDVQVLSTVPVMFSYTSPPAEGLHVARFLNDHIHGIVQKYPTRFMGLATVPLQDSKLACEELERCKALGFVGVQIGSSIRKINPDMSPNAAKFIQVNLDDKSLLPFFKRADELEMAIFVHPWYMDEGPRAELYWAPWLVGMPSETTLAICSVMFSGVLEACPTLKICFAHGGGCFPFTIARIEHGWECKHKDPKLFPYADAKRPSELVHRIWVDSLVHSEVSLGLLREVMGETHIMLGTDYPFPLGEQQAGKLIEGMPWTPVTKNLMLGENALKFFNRKKEQYVFANSKSACSPACACSTIPTSATATTTTSNAAATPSDSGVQLELGEPVEAK